LSGLSLLPILAITLFPSVGAPSETLSFWCVICGDRGLADAVLNVGLFAPFGAGLALANGAGFAWAGSAVLSGLIEGVQLLLPQRFSTLGDVLFNTGGGGMGAFLVQVLPFLLRLVLSPPRWARVAALALAALAFLVSSALVSPDLPDGDYFGQWTHELGDQEAYRGRILSAEVAGHVIPDALVPDQTEVKVALRAGEELRVTFLLGPPAPRPSHLFAIFDHAQAEVVHFWILGRDLHVHRRTRSQAFGLDQPEIFWPRALAGQEGDTLTVALLSRPARLCLGLGLEQELDCRSAGGIEGGWQLLMQLPEASQEARLFVSLLWLGLLALPAGLLSSDLRASSWAGIMLALGALTVSVVSPELSPRPETLLAPLLGAWVGGGIRNLVWRRQRGISAASETDLK
jgi:hypothetical protein